MQEVNEDLEKLVTERTKKLNDTVHELETFLYRASHDIRGPISSMLGLIEVTRIEPDHEKFYRVYNEFLHKTVVQLDRTLQKLLEKHIIEKNEVVLESIDKETFLKVLHDLVQKHLLLPSRLFPGILRCRNPCADRPDDAQHSSWQPVGECILLLPGIRE